MATCLARRNRNQEDFFLAGRSMSWPFVGFSLFATNISSCGLVGFAGNPHATGISVYNYEWTGALVLVFFARLCMIKLPVPGGIRDLTLWQ